MIVEMASKSEINTGLVQEGDAILLRCDKVYKPAVVERGRYLLKISGVHCLEYARDSYTI